MTRFAQRTLLLVLGMVLVMATGCSSCYIVRTGNTSGNKEGEPPRTATTPAGKRELFHDEAAGGHTLSRHVAKSDDELRERLQHERISAASSYTDHAIAEQAVGAALVANHDRISQWLSSGGGHPNLVLDYDSPRPIGRTLRRGQPASTPCSHAVVVLRWQPPSDYFVLTSYPECR
jgi:CDI toxin RNase A-like protein